MQTLADIISRNAGSADFELREVESIVGAEIATKSGATRGQVAGTTALAVQRVPLGSAFARGEIDSAVDWLARRIREGGSHVFNVAVRRQPTNLVLVVEWPRPGDAPLPVSKPSARGAGARVQRFIPPEALASR